MENEPVGELRRSLLLTQAKCKRVIAVRTRELAAHITNRIDQRVYIVRAGELEQEAAQLEAEASTLVEGARSRHRDG